MATTDKKTLSREQQKRSSARSICCDAQKSHHAEPFQKDSRRCEVGNRCLKKLNAGNMVAIKELFDRLDGRAVQATEISGPDGGPIETTGSSNFTKDLLKEILATRQKESK